MKKHVLLCSSQFPTTHIRKGEPTNFESQIIEELKHHTLRLNVDTWKAKIDECHAGKALVSVRIWTERPYRSPQREICKLSHWDEKGRNIELLRDTQKEKEFRFHFGYSFVWVQKPNVYLISQRGEPGKEVKIPLIAEQVAKNDGLSIDDFWSWFGDKPKEAIMIHFTQYRYENEPY